MSDCQDITIREQLPEYLHGALDDAERARVHAHLEWCAACIDELDIMRAALATAPAPAIDVARIVAAIPAYGETYREGDAERDVVTPASWETARRANAAAVAAKGHDQARLTVHRPWYANAYMRVAAGFLLAAVGVSGIAFTHRNSATTPAAVQSAPQNGVTLVGVSDLSDDNLEQLIQSMDDLDANPPADPDPEPMNMVGVGGGNA